MIARLNPSVVIIGGGPAGATASLLLARWGHAVQLITKAGADHRLAVSLPPSSAKLFAEIGVAEAIDRAGFLRSTGNTVWWGRADARVETFADGARGWQLDVAQLSEVILSQAVAAGVQVERRMVEAPPAGLVLDCTGRSGLIARAKNVRRHVAGPRTIALIGEWQPNVAWAIPDDTHTLVESYDDGWVWSVPVSGGARHIAAMVDPQRSALVRGAAPRDVYLAEIRKTRVFSGLVGNASLHGGPWGWDASPYDAVEYAGDDWLLVGDAGSFIDPLSSAGVKKALASGWLAAVTAHTCLASPGMKAHAVAFFSGREREITTHLFRESRRFLANAAAGHPHAFWEDRSEDEADEADDHASIQRAFDRLKSCDEITFRPGPRLRTEPKPMIRGHEIVLEPHVVTDDDPLGVRYVRGIDVVALIETAPAARQVPDLYDEYVQRLGPAPLDDFLAALSTAVARHWLVAE